MAQVCDPGCEDFNRLQRRIDAADRSYHRALAALQKIESRAPQPGERSEPLSPGPWPPAPRAKRAGPRSHHQINHLAPGLALFRQFRLRPSTRS